MAGPNDASLSFIFTEVEKKRKGKSRLRENEVCTTLRELESEATRKKSAILFSLRFSRFIPFYLSRLRMHRKQNPRIARLPIPSETNSSNGFLFTLGRYPHLILTLVSTLDP